MRVARIRRLGRARRARQLTGDLWRRVVRRAGQDSDAWARAHGNHLKPRVIDRKDAPVKEIVRRAPSLEGGVDRFPHLVSTPGFDPAPFITAGVWVTRDPETGSYNLGIYRGMIKAEDRIGCATDVPTQHLAIQWEKARRMKKPLEAAVFIGGRRRCSWPPRAKCPTASTNMVLRARSNGEAIESFRPRRSTRWCRRMPRSFSKAASALTCWSPKRRSAKRAAISARARWRRSSRSPR
jgi:hypothetical protein